mgnify:CR=1 FL=1
MVCGSFSSFLLDLKIVALTVWKVFSREGITKEGQQLRITLMEIID